MNTKYYEFNLLLTPSLKEDKLSSFLEELLVQLKDLGEPESEVEFKLRRLAYPIKKETEAWLTVFFFSIKDDLKSVEKILKEKKEILRYLILSKKRPKQESKKDNQKVNLEKVDQKVEELLKEE
ncbi:MAG: 30S ribosomal protein S6 [Candidatus Pacebacteria bacterium]|jgi:ribosomal protein S6|nr:30S ribosomal protein S6 [Candidatus Paceibacterota bacterium]NMB47332.1 hypothetical protein [Patescibacteria group bacterium]MDD2796759.1 30S ribosomal protein S6 [Candidatus Paceibacterota bacterium]MDD3048218.1 30S ribosomal protein S6 [Candidatus Paceibacterota bacterium]MDD3510045.1 30S ribosomal protein S6 [Candidatus Paceibacterota bacterium]